MVAKNLAGSLVSLESLLAFLLPSSAILLSFVSFTDKKVNVKLPKGFDLESAKLVLSNYDNNTLALKPYEARVYVWE